MPDIVMPRLSDSMEEGTILKWLKADGDDVRRGDSLAEIETDKATLTYEADAEGVLAIVAPAGETLPIGSVIARLGSEGAGVAPTAEAQPAKDVEFGRFAGTKPGRAAATDTAPDPGAPAPATAAPSGANGRAKASPLARRIAREQGIDLRAVTGSGPGGRIVKADV
ncbi:MAG TPA: E3 binding domain-containing protein, partial [Solirubrobacteraceae bacterium]